MRIDRAILLGLGLCAASAGPAAADRPLSAIDWLSESAVATVPPPSAEPLGIHAKALDEKITVRALAAASPDAVGLLPASDSGLPRDLWGVSQSAELSGRLKRLDVGATPALQDLLYALLLAETDPPFDSAHDGLLFEARIDALLSLGAVEQAKTLLDRAGPRTPGLFRRWFDAALLLGAEDEGCTALADAPDLAPSLAARIFCLAHLGDRNAAGVTLESARALGALPQTEDALLSRMLSPRIGTHQGETLPHPTRFSPLIFRLHDKIGEPLPAAALPLAYAHADLRPKAGWKAQIEAAERLARSGALSGDRLLELYAERSPAASGGVWTRAAAVQRFDDALAKGSTDEIGKALPKVWDAMRNAGLEALFASLYANRLKGVPLAGEAGALAYRMELLSGGYELAARNRRPETLDERLLNAVARGDVAGAPASDALGRAVVEGFSAAGAPPRLRGLLDSGRRGEAILTAVELMAEGSRGEMDGLSEALALFRAAGLEDVARRAALQTLILEHEA